MPTSSGITFKGPFVPLLSHPERSILICFRFCTSFDGGTRTWEDYENAAAIVYHTKSCTCLGAQNYRITFAKNLSHSARAQFFRFKLSIWLRKVRTLRIKDKEESGVAEAIRVNQ
jgi:hypothetical protein